MFQTGAPSENLYAQTAFYMKRCASCRTPQQLLSAVELILGAFERSAGSASMLGQAGTLMNPEVIVRMKEIQEAIRRDL